MVYIFHLPMANFFVRQPFLSFKAQNQQVQNKEIIAAEFVVWNKKGKS